MDVLLFYTSLIKSCIKYNPQHNLESTPSLHVMSHRVFWGDACPFRNTTQICLVYTNLLFRSLFKGSFWLVSASQSRLNSRSQISIFTWEETDPTAYQHAYAKGWFKILSSRNNLLLNSHLRWPWTRKQQVQERLGLLTIPLPSTPDWLACNSPC